MIVGFFVVGRKVDVLTDLVLFVLLVYVADEDGVAAPGSKLVGGWIFFIIVVLFFVIVKAIRDSSQVSRTNSSTKALEWKNPVVSSELC